MNISPWADAVSRWIFQRTYCMSSFHRKQSLKLNKNRNRLLPNSSITYYNLIIGGMIYIITCIIFIFTSLQVSLKPTVYTKKRGYEDIIYLWQHDKTVWALLPTLQKPHVIKSKLSLHFFTSLIKMLLF